MAADESTEHSTHLIDGLHVFAHFDVDKFRSGLQYKARSNDIFLITYPRSGTNWMATIIYGLLTNGQAFDDDINDYLLRTPFLEVFGKDFIEEKMRRPGAILTHLPFDRVPYNSQAKYICVVRNPKDVCISLWHFLTDHPSKGFFHKTFDSFFQAFINGQMPYCAQIDYLRLLWPHKNDNNVLLVSYEEMKIDLTKVIQKVARFLNIDITENSNLINRIATNSSFDHMKKNFDRTWNDFFSQQSDKGELFSKPTSFIREGRAGNWTSYMTNQQSQQIDEIFSEIFRDMPELNSFSYPHKNLDKQEQ